MITFLQGVLVEKAPSRAVLNVGGVGYEVFIPLSSYDRLPPPDAPVTLLTYHHIREDQQSLFGFATEAERDMFERLLDISGVGPKLALSVLSGLSVRELKASIVEGNTKRLSGISGIGKKTAERIVVELKDKISAGEALEATAGGEVSPDDLRLRDAVMALVALGYKQADALKMARVAAEQAGPKAPVEEVIRRSLARATAST
ncbi:MAG TPA: Holliday junction branch migration protein RuvA [Kiritimatiellia bacterium]|nr:Holliday junction branch migration protein RuvA [Kiritimatiellia bacterium]HMP00057.1 Holliday junction branch migration protein RuvA [Kiritimatiellia bacterium]HMP96538.1 Holliday junction branch migration protein RuvA [Kiritimatiellia bacterium]